ncbi:MAG: hypothetical protein MZU91_14405 [Desulfosudis oleivorans]|nr:hypothetical protein [Desulfosudis oleivorans]
MGAIVCGVDEEASRGRLQGGDRGGRHPAPDFPVEILADSKTLSESRRLAAAEQIQERALAWCLGWATHEEIDEINILRAALLAMARAMPGCR